MRYAMVGALLALIWATPAYATGGMRCAPLRGSGPILTLTLSHGAVAQIVSARLQHGASELRTSGAIGTGRVQPLIVGQSWFDRQEVRIDLIDAQAMRFEGQLRARFQPRLRGRPADGTFVRGGRTWRVRCVEA